MCLPRAKKVPQALSLGYRRHVRLLLMPHQRASARPSAPKQYRVSVPESTSRGESVIYSCDPRGCGSGCSTSALSCHTAFVSAAKIPVRISAVTTTSEASDTSFDLATRSGCGRRRCGRGLAAVALGHKSFWLDNHHVAIVQRLARLLAFGTRKATWRCTTCCCGRGCTREQRSYRPAALRAPASFPFLLCICWQAPVRPPHRILTARYSRLIHAPLLARRKPALQLSCAHGDYLYYCFIRLIEGRLNRFAIVYGLPPGLPATSLFGVLVAAAHAVSLLAMPRASGRGSSIRLQV